ncbi:hypothetical protein [Shinella sp.]|uniref:hypothetical protein n=1 Tax=Shinella sp. TaxID=1870904 RepID=UPI0040370938
MSGNDDKKTREEKPDLIRHYRPVAIRSVLAAHAMIPRKHEPVPPDPPAGTGFALPSGFHAVPDD